MGVTLGVLSFAAVSFGRKPFSSQFSLKTHRHFLVALFFGEAGALFLLSSQSGDSEVAYHHTWGFGLGIHGQKGLVAIS